MDRSFSSLRRVRLLGFCGMAGLLVGLAGCAQLEEISSGRMFTKDSQPKRTVKATTCVAYGDLRATLANESKCSGPERDAMRDEARRSYQAAIKVEPENLQAYQSLARLYQVMEKYDQAAETYHKGLEKLPKEKSLWFELGMCQAKQKDWDGALESLRMATQLDPENTMYNTMLGFCLARSGRYDECLALFTRTQGEAKAHYNLARMLKHVNRFAESKHHLRLALQADPELDAARELLAAIEAGKDMPAIAPKGSRAAPAPTTTAKAVLSVSFDDVDEAAAILDSE